MNSFRPMIVSGLLKGPTDAQESVPQVYEIEDLLLAFCLPMVGISTSRGNPLSLLGKTWCAIAKSSRVKI